MDYIQNARASPVVIYVVDAAPLWSKVSLWPHEKNILDPTGQIVVLGFWLAMWPPCFAGVARPGRTNKI